ncbi:MAG: Hsp70 family protein [Xanthomonadaceae bacterium]|nr:Hsp70 family protein [Xanthomonadaceae bacterium]
MPTQKPSCIGIDFGTTNTCVALLEGQSARVIALDKSLMYFPNRKEAFFGKNAIEQYFEREMEGRFFQSVKRLLPNSQFTGTALIGAYVKVEDLIARFLIMMMERIEKEVVSIRGVPIHMGRPARYSLDPENEALAITRFEKACKLAGFENLKFIEEPVAASRAAESFSKEEMVLVADLGGGTSDYTLYKSKPGKTPEVLSVHGAPVAGDALDSDFFQARLLEFFGSTIQYQRPFSSNVLTLPANLMRLLSKWHHHAFLREASTWNFILSLRNELVDPLQKPLLENFITLVEENLGYQLHQEVEEMKIRLSQEDQSDFSFKSYPIGIQVSVKRTEFESIITETTSTINQAALETCKRGGVSPSEVTVLQFTGGTSKVPYIRKIISQSFPNAKLVDQEVFTAVAEGLALMGLDSYS